MNIRFVRYVVAAAIIVTAAGAVSEVQKERAQTRGVSTVQVSELL